MSEFTNTNFSALVPWVSNMYLGIADAHQRTNLDFSLLLLCASFSPPFIPCPLLPSRLKSTWLGVRDLLHILWVSRSKRLWEIDLQSCLNHSWLWDPHYSHFVSVHPETRRAEQHPEFVLLSSQVHTWEYLVLSRIWGLLEEFCPTSTPYRETRQHALTSACKKETVNSCTKL